MPNISTVTAPRKPKQKRKVLTPEIATKVAVAAVFNPFEPESIKFEAPEGGTIADILKSRGLPAGRLRALIRRSARVVPKRQGAGWGIRR